MRDKRTQAALIQWLIPSIILLFIVVVLLIEFSLASKNRVAEDLEEDVVSTAGSYAQKMYVELNTMTKAGIMVADIYKGYPDSSDKNLQMLAKALNDHTFAHGVIISDRKGNAITHQGQWFDISEEVYFKERSDKSQNYTYVEEESIFSKQAIVSEIPVYRNGNIERYIFLYYPVERFAGMIKKIEFDSRSFYAIVKGDGSVINSVGVASVFVEHNFLRTLEKVEFYQSDYEKVKLKLPTTSKGVIGVRYQGETKIVSYVPMGIHDWKILVGVNQDYIDAQKRVQLDETFRIIRNLIMAIVVFFSIIIIINVIYKIRVNEHSKSLENKADTDLLTELNNKMSTERKIKEYIEKNPNKQAMLFVLDIDNFKKINDTMGHAFGDEVLRTLGLQIQAEFRTSDIKGRAGGDEFILFLKNIEDDEAIMKQAEKIALFFRDFQAGEYVKYSATASIGVAIFSKDGRDFETLYKAADKALYKAKKRGKNQLAFYNHHYDMCRGIVEE